VHLVEVDVVGVQALEAVLHRLDDVPPGAAPQVLALAHGVGELGGQDRLVPLALQRLAQEDLGLGGAVDIGRVKEVDPAVEGGVDHHARLGLVDPHAEVVAAEPDYADLEPAVPQPTKLHGVLPHRSDPRNLGQADNARQRLQHPRNT
jgi:hypothetical protein